MSSQKTQSLMQKMGRLQQVPQTPSPAVTRHPVHLSGICYVITGAPLRFHLHCRCICCPCMYYQRYIPMSKSPHTSQAFEP